MKSSIEFVLPDQWILSGEWVAAFRQAFFRYNFGFLRDELRFVLPLRIDLRHFRLSKSQRRVLRRNDDLRVEVGPIEINLSAERMFERHKVRFDHGVPDSLYNFLSRNPSQSPCAAKAIRVYNETELVAISYFDIGRSASRASTECSNR